MYLVHVSELRNLARQLERAARTGQVLYDHHQHGIRQSSITESRKIEGPDALAGFKYALRRGVKGPTKSGLDLLGGPYAVVDVISPIRASAGSYTRLA